MGNFSLILSASILLFVNCVNSSGVLRTFDAAKLEKGIVILTENDVATEAQTARHLEEHRNNRFVGDLVIGNRRPVEDLYESPYVIENQTDRFITFPFEITISGKIIHYLSVLNEENSQTVVCPTAATLGSSITKFNVRVYPYSTSFIRILIGTH